MAVGTAFAQLIGIALMPIWSRLYAPEDFSVQTLFWNAVCIVSVLITWRLECLVQLPVDREDAVRMVWLVSKLATWFGLGLIPVSWLAAGWLGRLMGSVPLAVWIPLIPLTAAVVSIATALQMLVQRDGKFQAAALGTIWSRVGMCTVMGVGGLAFSGPGGLVLAWLGGYLVRILYYARVLGWPGPVIPRANWFPCDYGRRAFGLTGSHLLLTLTATIPSVYVARSHGPKELGLFALALQIVIVPGAFLDTAISEVYYQRAAALHAAGRRFTGLFKDTVFRLVLFGVPAYLCFAFGLQWATGPVFGVGWVTAGRYGAILSVNAFFSFVGNAVSRTSVIVGIWWYLPLFHLLRLSTVVVACLAAAHFYFSLEQFLWLWTLLSSVVYLADLMINWRLAVCKAWAH